MVCIPHLAGDEYLGAGNARVSNALPNLVLILIDECAIEVTISTLQSMGYRFANLSWLGLPRAWQRQTMSGAHQPNRHSASPT